MNQITNDVVSPPPTDLRVLVAVDVNDFEVLNDMFAIAHPLESPALIVQRDDGAEHDLDTAAPNRNQTIEDLGDVCSDSVFEL